ncbi:TatD family deoxyribonuclease [Aliidiomarina sedimenti]|uniref:TatD family deoxyribonuclease n=1 Tax=Aliidiomarina sedimenti TaxID=1933879 RepID=A0ABY0BX41_9GAMM|nr:TatD family hydrolase [Aliidiomarina sedimenti]RUO28968.1 TatD family deoxyribonuclease [Aliidiomarina sedimenti]
MAALIDTHCHLNFTEFDDDRAEMLMRAHQVGVTHLVVPGVSKASWAQQRNFARHYQNWHNAFGLHPYFIAEHQQSDLEQLSIELGKGGAVAVGEIGLDATCEAMDKQRQLLQAQLQIAVEFDLPVILHHRKTLDEILKMVRDSGLTRGVVHAFSGSQQQAEAWVEQGFSLGVGGVITYTRARKTRAAIGALPLHALLLETDSPDMPTCGKQGQRNEPAYITRVFDALCSLRSEPPEVLREALWQNSRRLFNLNC